MKKRIFSLALALVLALGVAAPAFAASPTFTDVPEGHWAFQSVEEAAAKGLMNGTGNGQFSPNMKVSVAQFLTLVGRVVFPDVKAEGTDWYGPYVSKAQETGLLTGTQVDTGNVQAEITRYDMAVILRAAAKKLGVAEKLAETSEITDYGMVPTMYAEAVRAVYGLGLIKGDEKGNFNGSNTMMRSEVVTVVVRLAAAKEGSAGQTAGGATTEPGKDDNQTTTPEGEYAWASVNTPVATYDPSSVEVVQGSRLKFDFSFLSPDADIVGGYAYLHVGETLQLSVCEVPAGYGYMKDNLNERAQYWVGQIKSGNMEALANGAWESDRPNVATVDQNGLVTAVAQGYTNIRVQVPVIYYKDHWVTSMARITIYVDP